MKKYFSIKYISLLLAVLLFLSAFVFGMVSQSYEVIHGTYRRVILARILWAGWVAMMVCFFCLTVEAYRHSLLLGMVGTVWYGTVAFFSVAVIYSFSVSQYNQHRFPLKITGDFYGGIVEAEVWDVLLARDGCMEVQLLKKEGSNCRRLGAAASLCPMEEIGPVNLPFSEEEYLLEYDAEKNGLYFLYVPNGDFADDLFYAGILEYIDLSGNERDAMERAKIASRWYEEIVEPYRLLKREEAYEAGEIGDYVSWKTESSPHEAKWHWREDHDRKMSIYARYYIEGRFFQMDLNGDGLCEYLKEDVDAKGRPIARFYDLVQRTMEVEAVGRVYLEGALEDMVLNYYWDSHKKEAFFANLVAEPADNPGEYYLREYHYKVQKKWKEMVLETKEVSCEWICGGEEALEAARENAMSRLENWYQWMGEYRPQETTVNSQ